MKKSLPALAVLFLLVACSKKEVIYDVHKPQSADGKTPETCTFGLTKFNMIKRPAQLAGKKPQNPTTLPPPPPPAGAVILLDFDGHVVSGTAWNSSGSFTCAPANLSGENITEVFNRVVNDFSPFNVTVTTSDSVYNAANIWKRTRVIITETYEWYGMAGGTSFIGSFTWGDNTPCFVFSSLLNYEVKKITEAVSHEAGHTMGLLHQELYDVNCTNIANYNPGQGSGENGWAPIMGIGYYQNTTLWHDGPTVYGCTAYQNETALISSAVGGFKADDYSNTTANAPILTSSLQGLINSSADIDFFYLNSNSQKTISALPYSVGPNNAGANVNLVLKVYDGTGTLISVVDDPETLGAITTLGPGQYYLCVSTIANQFAGGYGMLGQYSIAVN